MKNGDFTVRLNNFNGTPTVSYNSVIIHNSSKVVVDGKSYDGFYVSYNHHDIATYGDVTTALVLGQMQKFYILNGNHSEAYKKLEKCLKSIREKTDFKPEKAVILGSGLGDYAEKIKIEKIVKYTDIEDFPVSTVQGHKGQFVFGYVEDVPVVLMQGRVHYYEGYPMQDVVLPTRLMGMMGAKKILLTNAAGGVNPSFRPGDFMLIKDHITTAVPSPLIGPNIEELGTRFPDMSEVYSKKLQDIIRKSAKDCGIPLQEGVYVQLTGPNYETPAEIRMVRSWGADAVGMSTACEAMAARHMGMEVCGISCITNMAAGVSNAKLNHAEVQETADRVAKDFEKLVTDVIAAI